MHWFLALSSLLAALPVGWLAYQWRLHARDNRDREFARYVFDQTRSTDALSGYSNHVAVRNGDSVGALPSDSG